MTTINAPTPTRPPRGFDLAGIRAEFPILATKANGKPLIYLDNGATTQKPQAVIDAISRYYSTQNANIHRGVYQLSQRATEAYEQARDVVARFINAADHSEVIFTRGTTEAINLVAHSWVRRFLHAGDEIIVSAMEHHSNIVPWQMACEATGAILRVIPMNDAGELDLEAYHALLNNKTKFVSVNHISNSLGTINPVGEIIALAHLRGAKVLIDGAQWVAHAPTDVRAFDADFYAFSGHKIYGPTGIGVLYGKRELLEMMPPYQGGGDMIETVTFEKTTYAPPPSRFEAGTPDIAGAIGLAAALDWLGAIGFDNVEAHEADLLTHATRAIKQIPGVRIIGTAREKAGVISFVVENPPMASFDIGTALDAAGVAVRTGHHCCMPVMQRFAIASTTRMSLAIYNTRADVDAFIAALQRVISDESARREKQTPVDVTGEVKFAPASASTPQAAADELADTFEFLGDRDARNQYILELGEKIPPMPVALKTEITRVHGCMSIVHLFGRCMTADKKALEFVADSDAHIVRGLIAVLERIYSGQETKLILAFDIEGFFRRIGLDQFISSQRRNGLAGMVHRIRALATQIEKE